MKIDILVLKDCMPTTSLGTYDLLRKANQMQDQQNSKGVTKKIEARLVACSRTTKKIATDNYPVLCQANLAGNQKPDVIFVPAFDRDLSVQMKRNQELIPWLKRQFHAGVDIVSCCSGAFALAESGLLNGKSATTHWALADQFRKQYPLVDLRPQHIIVDEGRIITCGGALSYINLVIYLIEKYLGHETALLASRMFVFDIQKSSQDSFAIFSMQKNHDDSIILKIQSIIERRLTKELSIQQLAREAALSRRQFVRRFKLATGNTPIEYIQRIRVEAAKKKLLTSKETWEEITWKLGYSNTPGFRKLFQRFVGLTPSEYRKKYTHAPDSRFIRRGTEQALQSRRN